MVFYLLSILIYVIIRFTHCLYTSSFIAAKIFKLDKTLINKCN